MSIPKTIRFSNFILVCMVIFCGHTSFQINGISTISAHCTNAANKRFSISRTYSLSADQAFTTYLRKGQDARFTVVLEGASPLSISVQTNRPAEINTQLFFNETVNLSKYLARNTTIMSIPCAPAGQYDIIVATASNIQLKLNVTQQKPFLAQKLLQYVQTSRIRYENRLHKRQVLFKWDKSKLDIHVMQYCLAINSHGNEDNFCDAIDHIIGQSPKLFCTHLKALKNFFIRPADRIVDIDSKRGTALACTGYKNKQILRGFVPHKKYFVDIFGVHKKIPGLTFKLGSTSFIFNRTSPIELVENRMEHGKLSEFDKRASFLFKIPKSPSNEAPPVKLLVIPCSYPVQLKLITQKKLKKAMDIVGATTVILNTSKSLDRFLFKFVPMISDDGLQRIDFKLVATRGTEFVHYPTLPSDTQLREITSLSTCTTSTITWQSSPDRRPITYCVAATKMMTKNFDDYITAINTCDVGTRTSNKILLNTNYDCVASQTQNSTLKGMERYQLKNLTPDHSYVIQVMMKISKDFLPYQTLKIHKSHHHCSATNKSNQNQLPNVMKLNYQQPDTIDNHISLP